MTTSRVTVPAGWGSSPAITASGDTAVLMRNTEQSNLFYWITTTDTAPTTAPELGLKVWPAHSDDSQLAMTLKDGERLWLAMPVGGGHITVMQGGA